MSVDVEQLYKSFGVLADAKDKAKDHVDAYKTILKGVKGQTAARRLSAQFISRFFKHFPDEAETAIDSLLDLCEDEDASIRKAAIKELPSLCKANKQHVTKLADVIVQILASDDSNDVSAATSALNTMFSLDAKSTMAGVISQIVSADDDDVREKALNYLCAKLKSATDLNKETEEFILAECKTVFQDVTGDEFTAIMQGLSGLHHIQTIQGRQQLLNLIGEQMDGTQDFDATDEDNVNRTIQCLGMAIPLCSKNVHSTRFVKFMCEKVLPTLSTITTQNGNHVNGDASKKVSKTDDKLELLKRLAELSVWCGKEDNVGDSLPLLFDKLKEYMPLPPDDEDSTATSADPKLQFSYVECLMFAFHQLGRHKPDFLSSTDDDDSVARLKDFRIRLQYFARGLQVYIKQLRASLTGKSPTELRGEHENQIKLLALKTCNNVNSLIKDLFHNPPSYKAIVNMSWKKPTAEVKPAAAAATAGKKRLSGGGDEASDFKKKNERSLYRAPSGKYSNSISSSRGGSGRGGGGGGGGGYRGRRQWGGRKKY